MRISSEKLGDPYVCSPPPFFHQLLCDELLRNFAVDRSNNEKSRPGDGRLLLARQ